MKQPETIPSVTEVEVIGDHRLRLGFDDGLTRELDFADELRRPVGPVFEPLKDPGYFGQVRVDEELGTIAWPNGADMDPVVLHGDRQPLPYEPHTERLER